MARCRLLQRGLECRLDAMRDALRKELFELPAAELQTGIEPVGFGGVGAGFAAAYLAAHGGLAEARTAGSGRDSGLLNRRGAPDDWIQIQFERRTNPCAARRPARPSRRRGRARRSRGPGCTGAAARPARGTCARQEPQRLALRQHVALCAGDGERGEELVLQRLVVLEPALLELLRSHPREVELQVPADHDRLLEAQPVQLAQPARPHLEPLGVVAERLGGLHGDAVAVHGVVGRIRRRRMVGRSTRPAAARARSGPRSAGLLRLARRLLRLRGRGGLDDVGAGSASSGSAGSGSTASGAGTAGSSTSRTTGSGGATTAATSGLAAASGAGGTTTGAGCSLGAASACGVRRGRQLLGARDDDRLAPAGHAQLLADAQAVAVAETVLGRERAFRGAEARGDLRERVAGPHAVAAVGGERKARHRDTGGLAAGQHQHLAGADAVAAADLVRGHQLALAHAVARARSATASRRAAPCDRCPGAGRPDAPSPVPRRAACSGTRAAPPSASAACSRSAGAWLRSTPRGAARGCAPATSRRRRRARCDRVGRRVPRQLELRVLERRMRSRARRNSAPAPVDPRRREELGVEVLRREAERAALVARDDVADVARAELAQPRASCRPGRGCRR